MDQKRHNEIIDKLKEKGVEAPCPRCGKERFTIAGNHKIIIQDNPKLIALTGPYIPTVIIICDNCGYISEHAIKALGIGEI